MARLVLVGLPGAGKSTVGAVLAHEFDVPFVDSDVALSDALGESVADFLRREGEAAFRAREAEVLFRELDRDVVVATGGGAVTTEAVRERLADEVVVWLDAPDETLLERVATGDRPLLGSDPAGALRDLRARRASLYESVACCRVDSSGTPVEVAAAVRRSARGQCC